MRFFDLRGFLIGCAIAGFFLIGYGVNIASTEWPSWRFSAALAGVDDCLDSDNVTRCTVPYVKKLVDLKSGSEVMDELYTRLTPVQCHYIGHVVGQQSYVKYRDFEVASNQCNRTCDSACLHGIIGETFAEQLGYDPKIDERYDLKHLGEEEIRVIGKQLCTTSQTCHGVGHTLFQIFGEFERGLQVCRNIATGTLLWYCANGFFMEYADVLSHKEIGSTLELEYPEIEALPSFCDWPQADEVHACFRYFPRIAITTFEANGLSREEAHARVEELCATYTDEEQRIACFAGIGSYYSYLLLTDQPASIRVCESFTGLQDKAACYLGQIAVSMNNRKELLVSYCGILPNTRIKTSCYQWFHHLFIEAGGAEDVAEQLCGEGNTLCMAGYRDRSLDAWEQVRMNFKN